MLTLRTTISASLAMMIGFAWIACDSTASAQGQLEVDLELILAVDVSRSMDGDEHRLQRDGYVAAFRHPDLLQAIKSGAFGRIAVVYFEWAGSRHQSVAVPWTIVGNGAEAEAFADALASQPILPEAGTSISASLLFAERIFAVSGTRGQRRAIDISGDGANNDGPPVEPVRQRLIAKGVTINGLPIELALGGAGDLTDYYERHVVGGPRAFAITVGDKAELAAAIHRKLVLEIAWLPTPPVPVSFFSADGASNRSYGRQGHGGSRHSIRHQFIALNSEGRLTRLSGGYVCRGSSPESRSEPTTCPASARSERLE